MGHNCSVDQESAGMDMAPSPPGGVGCKRVSGGDSAPVFLTYSYPYTAWIGMIVQIRTMSKGVEWSMVAAQSAFLARRASRALFAAVATMSLRRFIGFLPG